MLDQIYSDIVIYLVNSYLSTRDKIRLIQTCKKLYALKDRLTFDDAICIKIYQSNIKNYKLSQFNNIIVYLSTHLLLLSPTIQKLKYDSNKLIRHPIPNVIHLIFGFDFNQSIQNIIPKSVRYLEFGYKFNQSIYNSIPYGVKVLKFGYKFNQSIYNSIPYGVKVLKFGNQFNQSIVGCIPDSVEELEFGECFDQCVENAIPHSVKKIKLGDHFRRSLKSLPHCVLSLSISATARDHILLDNLPNNIHELSIIGCWANKAPILMKLPNSIEYLTLDFNRTIDPNSVIPKSVKHLTFGKYFDQSIKNILPDSITHLTFGKDYNQSIGNVESFIPSSVRHLVFGDRFNQEIRHYLPTNLVHLKFGANFNKRIKYNLPKTIQHLELGNRFDQEFYNYLPNLKYLKIRKKYSGIIFSKNIHVEYI